MPVPRHTTALEHVQLAADPALKGVTELRVHGVGGTPPDATLGDLAPEQVSGDAVAGFYRSSDHQASKEDRARGTDVDRHVEDYSWGGLTSRSRIRVLWLALLPFLLGNLAGWMCSAATRESAWRFRLHRLASGLGALALTVNTMLVAAAIGADVLAYQTARGAHAAKPVKGGFVAGQWWLAPLRWHLIAGHLGRQILLGVVAAELLVLVLLVLGIRSWRYESVRPPVRRQFHDPARRKTAAALSRGLEDENFWDGAPSVRLASWLHVSVATGFLALFLSVTVRAATGPGSAGGWWWTAIGLGGATIAVAVIYLMLDALDFLPDALREAPVYVLLALAALALIVAGVFAWRQPASPASAPAPAQLPGLSTMVGWTGLAIAASLALVLISTLIGLVPRRRVTLAGGPWVTLMLAFGLLNLVLLGVGIWVAHLVGPVTNDAAAAVTPKHEAIYLSYVVTSGVPLTALAAVAAVAAFTLVVLPFLLWPRPIPPREQFELWKAARTDERGLTAAQRPWIRSGLWPYALDDDQDQAKDPGWKKSTARAEVIGRLPHTATWLLWGMVVFQVAVAVSTWRLHLQPPVAVRNVGLTVVGLILPALAAWLWAGWNDPDRRRKIGVLWDVGTFWPRSYHPLAPPCYAERAVPDLQRRMWWLHDNGGGVVLVAHSQGAMLATAALVQRECRPVADHPALITFGSPVCNLYQWGFPGYVPEQMVEDLAPGKADGVTAWKNIYYPTDPIGGPVGVEGVDEPECDPAVCWYVYGQKPPAPTRHSGYWADSRVWKLVNKAAVQAVPSQLANKPDPRSNGHDRRRRRTRELVQASVTILTVIHVVGHSPQVLRRFL